MSRLILVAVTSAYILVAPVCAQDRLSAEDLARGQSLISKNHVDMRGWKITGVYRYPGTEVVGVHVQSIAGNLEVYGEARVFQFNKSGQLDERVNFVYEGRPHFASVKPTPRLNLVPRISKEEALAKRRLDARSPVELGILNVNALGGIKGPPHYVLIWKVMFGGPSRSTRMIINAQTGDELYYDNGIRYSRGLR